MPTLAKMDANATHGDVEDGRCIEAMPLPILLGRQNVHLTASADVKEAKPYKVVIIGMGPRGLVLLERLLACTSDDVSLEVHCVEPQSKFGQGCHPESQGKHLVINTIAEQLTMFTDESCDPAIAGPMHKGPSLFEWCKLYGLGFDTLAGLVLHGDAVTESTEVTKNTYPPRALLGRYLNWCYEEIKRRAPPNFVIVEHTCEAMALEDKASDVTFDVKLSGGGMIHEADYVFLTTGHTAAPWSAEDCRLHEMAASARDGLVNAAARFYAKPYPMSKLAEVEPATSVAVLGAGLTMCDIVTELTVGRGGRFVREPSGGLRYEATGLEPQCIYICSRSGVPHCARAKNEKGLAGTHKAVFLTPETVHMLRGEGMEALNFQTEVLPLLEEEMRHAYWISHLRKAGADAQAIQTFCDNHTIGRTSTELEAARHAAAAACAAATGAKEPAELSWADLEKPLEGYPQSTCSEIDASVRTWLLEDLAMAREGNLSNPLKSATDVVRDVRDVCRDIIDFGGLSADSSSDFARFFRTMNRIAVGPPLLRNEQLLALHDAGLVYFGAGPGASMSFNAADGKFLLTPRMAEAAPLSCDVMIKAQIDGFDTDTSESPLIRSLRESGLIRRYEDGGYAVGGLEVAPGGNCVVDRAGRARHNFVAMGPLCEGANFYTFVLPRPMVGSRSLMSAGLAARSLVKHARKYSLGRVCTAFKHEARPSADSCTLWSAWTSNGSIAGYP